MRFDFMKPNLILFSRLFEGLINTEDTLKLKVSKPKLLRFRERSLAPLPLFKYSTGERVEYLCRALIVLRLIKLIIYISRAAQF
jgi:hypothetical protein